MPFERRTRAIFRKAEFGFFGVVVVTFKQTPRLNGAPRFRAVRLRCKVSKVVWIAGYLLFFFICFLPLRTSWLVVGMIYTIN